MNTLKIARIFTGCVTAGLNLALREERDVRLFARRKEEEGLPSGTCGRIAPPTSLRGILRT